MKKLLMISICCIALACTNPEDQVDEPSDSAGIQYKSDDELNTRSGGVSNDNEGTDAGLDTSNSPKDTTRAKPKQ